MKLSGPIALNGGRGEIPAYSFFYGNKFVGISLLGLVLIIYILFWKSTHFKAKFKFIYKSWAKLSHYFSLLCLLIIPLISYTVYFNSPTSFLLYKLSGLSYFFLQKTTFCIYLLYCFLIFNSLISEFKKYFLLVFFIYFVF